ncbi:unnamed protein product [Caenorhabditis brenneri]
MVEKKNDTRSFIDDACRVQPSVGVDENATIKIILAVLLNPKSPIGFWKSVDISPINNSLRTGGNKFLAGMCYFPVLHGIPELLIFFPHFHEK